MYRKYIQVIYFVLLALLSLFLYNRWLDLANYCRIALSIVLFFYLWFYKSNIARNVVLWLVVAIFFSIVPFIFLNPYKFDPNNIFAVFFLIVHFCYIQIFKIEKANIFLNKANFKHFFLLIIIAFVALELLNYYLDSLVFYLYIVLAFQKIAMIWLAFNRNLSSSAYKLNVWAMMSLLLSDAFYVLNIFINAQSWDVSLEVCINLFYVLGQFFLFDSIICHHYLVKPAEDSY